MSFDERPELSVIVPVLNEAGNLAKLLEEIARQREVRLELIVSDGGSSDGTAGEAARLGEGLSFPLRVLEGESGRGRQMNRGAGVANAPALLFLHADSCFPDPLAFRRGLDALAAATGGGDPCVAGHFALEFDFAGRAPLPYRFYGAKATLDRPGCTHGDQGMLIGRPFFCRLSGFREDLPVMEDTLLAGRVREEGRWLLLPARIRTSPRRFLTEGLLPRQTLNAILMNLAHTGHLPLVEALRGSYRSQHAAERLRLECLLPPLAEKISRLPPAQRKRLWSLTGEYVRSNAWQIPFFFDVWLGWAREGEGGRLLRFHDRLLARLIDNRVGDQVAAALVRVWFRLTLSACRPG